MQENDGDSRSIYEFKYMVFAQITVKAKCTRVRGMLLWNSTDQNIQIDYYFADIYKGTLLSIINRCTKG